MDQKLSFDISALISPTLPFSAGGLTESLKKVIKLFFREVLDEHATFGEVAGLRSKQPVVSAGSTWQSVLWVAVYGFLLLPLLLMQATDDLAWTGNDLFRAAVLLVVAGLACELLVRSRLSQKLQATIGGAIVTAVVLIWAQTSA